MLLKILSRALKGPVNRSSSDNTLVFICIKVALRIAVKSPQHSEDLKRKAWAVGNDKAESIKF